ncbi:MAG: trimethylamine methyltransferase family protein [Hyphomicrobiales bacterium]|nr:trimethylamine methyltransferase family protein [Hyphomicrobiales bacterium]MCP5373731.1 trimethylamine methyltransferase family protein [Hyphomicrobiales bacterium]
MQDPRDPQTLTSTPSADDAPRRGRRRPAGRGGGGDRTTVQQRPWKQPRLRYEPTRAVSDDELESIHQASLRILEEIGMDFLLPEARQMLKAAGADVDPDSERVRLDRGLVEQALSTAPSRFTLHARNPDHNLEMGGDYMAFCCIGSAPNASDMEGGRRPGTHKDFRDLVRLSQALNVVHVNGGYPVEPIDLPPRTRHLDALSDLATLTDKLFHAYSLGRTRILDGLEMVRIARGVDAERLMREPSLFTIINTNSPLKLDGPMLEGMMEMARHNQVVVVTPFTLAGAMAPVTLAGALALQNAEALAGLVVTQAANPGAPTAYGGFTSNVDMKSGAPAFGTPEYMRTALVGGQLARRYGLPYRSSNVTSANTVDAQAGYESVFSLWGAVMGGVNLLKHGTGWMEGGLCASFEKMILDADLLQMVAEFLEPIEISEAAFAVDAIREVGPGGHFFGSPHTMERYRDAFYAPMVSDWRNYESWREAGAPDAMTHAHRIYKQLLADYTPPPMDPAIAEELAAFVARRKEEGGAPADT